MVTSAHALSKVAQRPPLVVPVPMGSVRDAALQRRYDGSPLLRSHLGALVRKDGAVWYFQHGCLHFHARLKTVVEVHGDIYKRWQALGGMRWGAPETDESPCADGVGRYNHFNNDGATIMWSPASGAHGVVGDIRARWAALGWERSYLGYPLSDEVDFPDGGRVSAFQRGGIYWWSDTGAIDADDVVVEYTGLVCITETGESSGADEPYVLLGTVTPFGSGSHRSRTYSGVDSHTSRPDRMAIYRGKPNGITLALVLMENDEGDPAKYQDEITAVVQKVHEAGTFALGLIPIVGIGIAAVMGPLIQKFVPDIGKGINNLFGFGDDRIGRQVITLTGKDMLLLATRTADSTYKNVVHRFSSNNLRGENANYKVYFRVAKA